MVTRDDEVVGAIGLFSVLISFVYIYIYNDEKVEK